MEVNNKLYKNQGIHVISSIFTVEDGITKILLVRRKNNPYKDSWALVGGALYNNEAIIDGMKREIKEKSGIDKVKLYENTVFDEIGKTEDINMRMIAVTYLGLVDKSKINIIRENRNTIDAEFFDINKVPNLAFCHNEILKDSIEKIRELIIRSDILKELLPKEFTLPELQKLFEGLLNKKFDRRNFRKKVLNLNIIDDLNKEVSINGKKPAKLYKFKDKIESKKVF